MPDETMDFRIVFIFAMLFRTISMEGVNDDIDNIHVQLQLLLNRLHSMTVKLDSIEDIVDRKIQAKFEELRSQGDTVTRQDAALSFSLRESMNGSIEGLVRQQMTKVYRAWSTEKGLMRKMRSQIQSDVEIFKEKSNDNERNIKELKDSLDANTLRLDEKIQNKSNSLEHKIAAVSDDTFKLNNNLSGFEKHIIHISEETTASTHELKRAISDAITTMNDTFVDLKADIKANLQNISLNKNLISSCDEAASITNMKIAYLSENITEHERALNKINVTISEMQVTASASQENITSNNRKISNNADEISVNVNKLSTVLSRLSTNTNDIAQLSSKMSSTASSISSLSSRISSNYNAISSISSKISTFSSFTAGLGGSISDAPKGQTIVFNRAITNVGSDYSTYSGVYTAPVSGYYLFLVNIESYSSGRAHVDVVKNGSEFLKASVFTIDETGGNAGVIYLSKGDKVWVETSGGKNDIYPLRSTFSGALLHA